jgi:mannose-6-phosphate isomerase-like protein (cupin superfamily)
MRTKMFLGALCIAAPAIAQTIGPSGQPQTVSIIDLVERNSISGNVPRGETLVACSGNTRTTVVQLNQDQADRLYDSAEITYYVVAGEGAVRVNGRNTGITPGTVVAIPRGTSYGVVRRGQRPLILVATLSGAPCEEAR